MAKEQLKQSNRYVNDLRRAAFSWSQSTIIRSNYLPISVALIFIILAGIYGNYSLSVASEEIVLLIAAAAIGGYMALNIGANDVANNMGPAVGGKVLTIFSAVLIAATFESAGALLAGGDVVKTVAKGIITPGNEISLSNFRYLMLSALLSAALWINLATYLNAPVSTTHSIVGGVMGAGIAGAGFGLVNWLTMSKIAASWVISPVFGGLVAAGLLFFIKRKIINTSDRNAAAIKWVPFLVGLMAAAFMAYMSLKGLKKIWRPDLFEICLYSIVGFILAWRCSMPFIKKQAESLSDKKQDIYRLFNLPLICGVSLLCFAHGANDVANAVGPLAAIVSSFGDQETVAAKVTIPIWVMLIGALGIALGLLLFGPKLINTVGQKITRLNAPRAYCVALASAVTVLIATALGLPVSSTHIAIGAIFGVGFLRETLENPNKKRLRPGHKLNHTAAEAFKGINIRLRRKLVRREFVFSIMSAWIITVPASAFLAAILFYSLQFLISMG
jgi:PiT family inorganic phosphate transporter